VTDVEEVWFAGCHFGTCIDPHSEILFSCQYRRYLLFDISRLY
jgi:hypothetical protein